MKNNKTIIVIGSGFFGIWASNHLVRQYPQYHVKLITRSDYTYFLVSSIRVPVTNDTKGSIIPLKEVVDDGVEIVKGEVNYFDGQNVKVTLSSTGIVEVLPFHSLVIATGSKWRDPIGYTYGFGDDYEKYFEQQHQLMEKAKTIVLIGGGYTNVELAGELHDRYNKAMSQDDKKIVMVHSQDLLLPRDGLYSEPLRKRCTEFFQHETRIELILGSKAKVSDSKAGTHQVVCDNGQTLEADLVLTSIGVEPSVPPNAFKDLTDSNGFIRIDETFQCKGVSGGNIFAIGDVTDFEYKGLFRRGPWLGCMLTNIDVILSQPDIRADKLCRVKRHKGHITAYVSLGAKAGCGQFVLPLLGTVMAPEWFILKKKSADLHVKHSTRLFKW